MKARLAALVAELERGEWRDAVEIADDQRRQLGALAAHFARHSRGFAERLAAAGLRAEDLAQPGGLQALPPLDRRTLQRDFDRHAAAVVPAGHGGTGIAETSGSTGEPVKVRRTGHTYLHWLALTVRYHRWQEPDFSGRLCALRAGVGEPVTRDSWGPPLDLFGATGPSLGIDNGTDLAVQIEMLRRFRPTSLIIYPSNLAALLDRLDSPLDGLERVRTVGETLSPALRAAASDRLGVPVHDCYSSQEVGYVAIECDAGGHHVMAETLIVEVVDAAGRPCAPGEVGRLLLTDISNGATPLIRYAVGDYAAWGEACPCGRGLPTLSHIAGRERNMVRTPDGRMHWPITGFRKFREIGPIVQYQLVQHALDRIEMRLVVEHALDAAQEDALRAVVRAHLSHDFPIDFTYFDEAIPTGPGGKFEEFVRLF